MIFIDVSMYQGEIDWKRVAASGVKAAYLKATEGVHWNDPKFQENRKAANAAGIHVGAYHFASLYDGGIEARHFLTAVGGVGPKDLKPVLDLESNPKGLSSAALRAYVTAFNKVVHDRTGVWPMFYSYASFIEGCGFTKPVGNGLWIAAYGRNDGKEYPVFAPRPWRKYVAHQFTSRGTVPGIKGPVDVSVAKSLTPLLAHPVKNALRGF